MVENLEVAALIAIGIDEATAQKSVKAIDNVRKGLDDAKKSAEATQQKFQKMAETGEKLASVGAGIAAAGAAILAPAALAASQYAEKFKGFEKQANDFVRAQERSQNATTRFGRVAASALAPLQDQMTALLEKATSFAESHPELVQAAIQAGSLLAAGGGAIATIGVGVGMLGKIGGLVTQLGSSGVVQNIANVAVPIAALAAGAKGAEILINQLGKASGNAYMENYKLADALKTAREILGTFALTLASAFVEAKKTLGTLGDIIGLLGASIKNKFEEILDRFATGFRTAVINIQEAIGSFRNGLIDGLVNMFPQLKGQLEPLKDQDAVKQTHGGGRGGAKQLSAYDLSRQQEDAEFTARQKRREGDLAETAGGAGSATQATYEQDKANLAKFAEGIAKFAETGSLGSGLDNLIGGIAGKIKDALGSLSGGSSGEGGAGVGGKVINPEAVRAFIEFRQQVKEFTKQAKEAVDQLAKTRDTKLAEVNKTERTEEAKINAEYMKTQLQKFQEFRDKENQEQLQANKERLKLLSDLNDNLYDAALNNDVTAFLRAQREGDKALREQKSNADEAAQQRQDDYLKAAQQDQDARQAQLDALHADSQEKRDLIEADYKEQKDALLKKQADERAAMQQHFAEQLAGMQGNLAGLNDMQNAYYASQTAAFEQYLEANKTTLQKAIQSTYDNAPKAGSAGDGGGGLAGLLKGLGIPSLDTGIDSLPKDMLVYAHKGERITPAAQNNGGSPSVYVDQRGAMLSGGATQADLQAIAEATMSAVNAGIAKGFGLAQGGA